MVVPKCKSMHICVNKTRKSVTHVQISLQILLKVPCVCGFGHIIDTHVQETVQVRRRVNMVVPKACIFA